MNIRMFLLIVKSKFTNSRPVTLEQINDLLQKVNELEIKYQRLTAEVSAKFPTNNLTVVSQKPISECGEILQALTRRQCSDSEAQSEAEETAKRMNRKLDALMKPRLASRDTV